MVRFKTRWLLLAIDDRPLCTTSPFPLSSPNEGDAAHPNPNSSASLLSAAHTSSPTNGATTALTPQHITRLLRASLACNFGDVASGAFGGVLTCKYYSTHTGTAIVRCSRDAARLVWASATLISSAVEISSAEGGAAGGSGRPPSLRMRVVHCGGTIKKVQNKAIELDRKLIMRLGAKQKRLAAVSAEAETPMQTVSKAPAVEDSAPVAPAVPIAPVDDDEDLGEALDPSTPSVEDPAASTPTISAAPQASQRNTPKSKQTNVDPETQALLEQSRKQISSISM